MASMALAQKDFLVNAPRERVWRLIGKVIFSVLPGLENMEILDENNFRAVLRMKLFGLQISLKLKGEMVDMAPPESFGVKLFLEGLGGLFRAEQKVSFAITPVEKDRTAVSCRAAMEDPGFLPRVFLLGQARKFAGSTFEAIEKRLQDLA